MRAGPKVGVRSSSASLLAAVLAALVAVPLPGLAGEGPWVAWRTETVDAGFVLGYPSIALDSDGLAHVLYGTSSGMKYAKQGLVGWSFQTLPPSASSSIDVDSADRPHISYKTPFSDDLRYLHFDGVQWLSEAVDAAGQVGGWSHIKVDGQDFPHIAYWDQTNNDLKYAFKDSAGWHVEVVDTDGGFALWNGLDLDGSGVPRVAYAAPDANDVELKYASRATGSWVVEIVDSNGGADASIAVDELGRPHVAYLSEGAPARLKYALKQDGVWTLETADSDDPTGAWTSIAVDSQNRPHISYHQAANPPDNPLRNHLRYATRDLVGEWSTEFVDIVGSTAESAIAVDTLDSRPRMVYRFSCYQPSTPGCSLGGADIKFAEPVVGTLLNRLRD